MIIEYEDIKVRKQLIINKGTIDLPETGITVIRGENGSGKSLLLRKVFLEMENACYIDQSTNNILREKNVLENIKLNDSDDCHNEVLALLKKFDSEYLLSHSGQELSGGEKRILSLLRGIDSGAQLLIFDEPTNELDHKNVVKFLSLINQLKKDHSIICVTHDDRIVEDADRIYEITNRELVAKNVNSNVEKEEEVKKIKYVKRTFEKRYQFFESLFTRRISSMIFILLVMVTAVYSIEKYIEFQRDKVQAMETNQIDIFMPNATNEYETYEGAIPIGVFADYDNGVNISEISEIYIDALNKSKTKGLTFSLKKPNNIDTDVFVIELYDISNSNNVYVPERYTNTICNDTLASSLLDTTDHFTLYHDDILDKNTEHNVCKMTDIEAYNTIVNIQLSSNENMRVQHLIIRLDEDYGFSDFLSSEYFDSISSGNYMIRSNETILIYNSIESLRLVRTALIILFSVFGLGLLLDITFSLLYFKEKKSTIKTIVNYGVDQSDLSKIIKKKYSLVVFKSLSFIALLLYCVIRYSISDFDAFIYTIMLLVILYILILEIISSFIFKNRVSKQYDWRYR